jgi:hypothetical protein
MAQRRLAGLPLDFGALRIELKMPGEFSPAAQNDAEQAALAHHHIVEDRTAWPTGSSFGELDSALLFNTPKAARWGE